MEELGYEQNNLQQNISMRKIGVVFPKSKTDVYEILLFRSYKGNW